MAVMNLDTTQAGQSLVLMTSILASSTEYSIIGKDLDGTILLWNEGAQRLYGYEPDEVVGKANSSILHTPEDVAEGRPKQMMEIALREGKWEGVLTRVRKSGERFTARVVITPRRAPDGHLSGFLLISKDVSGELKFTRELRKTKLFDSAIVGTAQEAVDFIANILQASTEYSIVGKGLDGTILLWNEGSRRLYGYEPEEVVGKANSSILHIPADVAAGRHSEIMEIALREGKWEGTLQRARKNGDHFTARVVITPRRDSFGQPVGFLLISKDISGEIRLSEQLQATQLYTRSLIESSIDALMTTDSVGVITDVNQQMEALTGYARDELIGSRFKNHFTNPEAAEEGIRRVLRRGRVTNYELTARARDGRETVVSYNASTFRDAEGQLQGVLAAARDITEQKKLEHQLRESESYHRGLIEASVDGLITVDASGWISDVNEQMCRMTGYSREELIGTAFADYFVDADRARSGVAETFENGVVKEYVLTLSTRQRGRILVSFNASVFRDAAGAVRGIFASARDITQQAELQAQLAEERAYNRGLIEAALDGLITVDPLMIITDVNETMCRMSGYTREELVHTPFPQYFTDPRRAGEGVRLTLDKGAATDYELTLRSKDGREALVSFNAAIFKDQTSGAVRGIFASARDITRQAQLQTQFKEERAYNRGLIEASVDGLVTVDEQTMITDVNETMCRMVGRQRSHLVGSAFHTYFTEPERAAEGVRLTFREGSVANYVLTLQVADGRQLPVSFNAAVFKDAAGAVKGIFASARDIASQKQLEEKLQASQVYTRSLIESNIDALMTTDSLGLITDVNQQMETLTGFKRDDLIGTPFKNYFTDPLRAEAAIRLVLREDRVTNYELTARAKGGKETVVSYNATTFFDREGKLQGVFAAARDITAQKVLEDQLREQQTYLRGLIESTMDGLVTVDRAGFITDINDRMCQMTGYGRQELLGTPFSDYFTDPERATLGVRQTLDVGFVTEYALTLLGRSRRLLHVSFNASVFKDQSGNVQGIWASARDITDHVRLEEQLREQQTYLRGLIESSVDGLITVDPEGFITDLNEQMCRMSGYSREELIGSQFKQYFTDPANADLGVKRTLAEGVVTNYELVLKVKTGRKATVSFNASIFRSGEGRVQGIFASARDISEQARLQTQLIEQQVYSRSLIEASPDAQFAIAPDGTITDVNEGAERLTGHSRKQLVCAKFSTYFTDPEQACKGVLQTLEERRVIGYELTLITRYGRRIVVSFNAGVFTDAAGKPLGILAAARDITAQKELESRLRDSQFYTRSLIESNIDALMTTDPLGIITDVNEQMKTLTGFSREELIGSAFKQYFTDADRAEDGIRQVLRLERVTNYELTVRSRAGKETVVSYNATTFYDQAGMLHGVFAAARDVTERKRFEQTLQEKNVELEKASLAKNRFLSSMSHELRTPLNAIIGFTGTLLMQLPGPLNPDQDKQLKTIQSSGRHLLSLINDLLDLAKIESGKVEIRLQETVCGEVVEEVVTTLRPLAQAKSLELRVVLPDYHIITRTDRRALSQILINLASNAIKFTAQGWVVLELEARQNGEALVAVHVRDSGVGIRTEDQQRLFQPFERVASTARVEGTGLGLHLSLKLAELIGGRIECESEFGKGSCFTLLIPQS